MRETLLLAGDIGGTKTTLAIYSSQRGPRLPLAEATFASADYASLQALAAKFLAQTDLTPTRASFSVADGVMRSTEGAMANERGLGGQ